MRDELCATHSGSTNCSGSCRKLASVSMPHSVRTTPCVALAIFVWWACVSVSATCSPQLGGVEGSKLPNRTKLVTSDFTGMDRLEGAGGTDQIGHAPRYFCEFQTLAISGRTSPSAATILAA